MYFKTRPSAALIGALCLALYGGMATAASDTSEPSSSLDEVVVTAQRREQNLQDVPLAVSSFSAKDLEVQQITSTLDIARNVPNFIASNNVGQASANVYFIRGLGQTQSFPTFEPQVGTYVDDIYIGRQNANNFALFGLDQLQVLRGPQGTLFGRNSTGGAVVVSLQKPQPTFGGDLEVGYGAWGRWFGHGYVDAPISDELLTRFAAFGINDDGYVQNLTTGQTMNKTKDWGVREAISFLPSSNISWNLSGDYGDNDAANVLNQPLSGHGVNGSDRVSYSGFSQDGGALTDFLTGAKGRLGQGVDVRSYGAMSNLKIGFSAGTLDFITGYRGLKQLTGVDFPDTSFGPAVPYDQGAIGQFALAQDLKSDQYSQEVKWTADVGDRFNYTAGAFYLYEKNNDDFGAVANLGILFGAPYIPFPLGDETSINSTHSSAIYAQGDYKFTDALTLTLGGRFTHEIKTLEVAPNTPTGGFTTADIQAAGYATKLTANEFTPRIALQYRIDPDLMFYVSATRGFQGGGWNGLAFSAATFNNFAPETVWSYETGMRSEWLDHTVRLNVNFFYEDVKAYQLLSDAGEGNFVSNNAANFFGYGMESELAWRPIDALTLSLNVGLMQAAYYGPSAAVAAQQTSCREKGPTDTVDCGSGIVDAFGNLATPSNTPHGNASLHAAYDLAFGGVTVSPNIGVQWTGSQNVGTEGLPGGESAAYTTLDAGVAFKPSSTPVTVTLECKNCTMKNWPTAYLFGYTYYNVPGFWDARVNYKF
jgi:iron complex outermembrane receptor protein